MNLDIIKAKLARGGQMNGGEIKLVVADIVKLFEAQQEKINALEEALDALARRSDRGPKKSSQTSEVRSETDE
jgi:hypothetical protein